MEQQASIQAPEITDGPGYSFPYALYLHSSAWILRKAVSWWVRTVNLFDKTLSLPTPGLGEGHVRISVCVPKGTGTDNVPKGLLLVAEGGGFVLGQPTDGEHIDRRLSDSVGLVVVSVDYAKSPRYPYPHSLLQLYEVLRWALGPYASEALGVKIDPSRVAIMGNSAGGNLMAALTLLLSFTSGPCAQFRKGLPATFRQTGQVLLYPSVACNKPYVARYSASDPETQAASLPVWAATFMEASYLPPCIDRSQIFIAPVDADAKLLQSLNLPPTLCTTAGKDCLKTEAQEYAGKLKQAGVDVTEHVYPQAIHGFSHHKNDYALEVEDCWNRVSDFLETHMYSLD